MRNVASWVANWPTMLLGFALAALPYLLLGAPAAEPSRGLARVVALVWIAMGLICYVLDVVAFVRRALRRGRLHRRVLQDLREEASKVRGS